MRAMVFAAGLGTRLRPLTDSRPKALVEINGRTMLEMTLSRLRKFGVSDVVINVFHHAAMIEQYLKANNNFGLRIQLSHEEILLDTGGGLKKAAHLFLMHSHSEDDGGNDSGLSDEPLIVHNVDVLSTIDIGRMVQFHLRNQACATLAVQDRKSSRYLLFDEQLQLCGRRFGSDRIELIGQSAGKHSQTHALAFCGIHVVSPRLLAMLSEDGAFSIISSYLRLAERGEKIFGYPADEYYWRDLGTPENVARADQDLKQKIVEQ